MTFINNLFGIPLGYIMWAIYKVFNNYGISILLFTLVTKILLFPLSVKQQKGTAKMAAFQPKIAALQKKYGNNKEKMQEEQMKLYSEEGVNPMGSCLPLLIQMPVLFGIIDVVYRPMTHIMRFSADVITKAAAIATTIYEKTGVLPTSFKGYQQQLYIMEAYSRDPSQFDSISGFAEQVGTFKMTMFGGAINLGQNPTWTWPVLLIPILAGLSQLLVTVYMQAYQKKTNPAAQTMGAMNSIMYIMPVVSIWMAFTFPAGVGFYWIMQSIFSFGQSVVLNKIYTPERVAEMVKIENAKKKAKKKNKGPSLMQRALEQQKTIQNDGKSVDKIETTATDVSAEIAEVEEVKISKSVQKDMSSKLIADARRKYAEKYGDEMDDADK